MYTWLHMAAPAQSSDVSLPSLSVDSMLIAAVLQTSCAQLTLDADLMNGLHSAKSNESFLVYQRNGCSTNLQCGASMSPPKLMS